MLYYTKNEDVLKFEKNTRGTILSLFKLAQIIPAVLMVVGFFLPMLDYYGKANIFLMSANKLGCFFMFILIYIFFNAVTALLIEQFKRRYIAGRAGKGSSIAVICIAGGSYTATLLFICLAKLIFCGILDIDNDLVDVASGLVIVSIAAALEATRLVGYSLALMPLFNGRTTPDNMTNIVLQAFNVLAPKPAAAAIEAPSAIEIKDSACEPAPAEASTERDIEEQLEKYKQLLDKGLIDENDYNEKKRRILGL